MTAVAEKRVVSPSLVGRSDELDLLVRALSDAPAVVVVEGEAGVGKTRLVAELSSRTELRGRVIGGGCRHVREPFPLGPLAERHHLVLAPLDAEKTGALAAAILGTDRVSDEFAGYVHERTSGLPFAVEELLALLRSRGTLVPRGGGWARRTLDALDVPTGIRDSVLERVSRLSDDARAVAEAAGVLQTPMRVCRSWWGRARCPRRPPEVA